MVTEELTGVWAKLDRAVENLSQFNAGVQSFVNLKPYRGVVHFDSQTGEHVMVVFVHRHVPLTLSVIAGDCLHDLRSALDHLAFQMVLRHHGPITDSEERQIEFPIHATLEGFNNSRKTQATLNLMSDGMRAAVKQVQPFQATTPLGNVLAIVHSLNRIDKHRRLKLVYFSPGGITPIPPHPPIAAIQPFAGKLEDGAEVTRVRFVAPGEVQVGFNLALHVAIDEGDGLLHLPSAEDFLIGAHYWLTTFVDEWDRRFFKEEERPSWSAPGFMSPPNPEP